MAQYEVTQMLMSHESLASNTDTWLFVLTFCSVSSCVISLTEPPEVNGSMNLITHHGLQTAYAKYCGKKMKEDLSSTLSLPGNINLSGNDDNRYAFQQL